MKSKCTLTIEVDEEANQIKVSRAHDPVIAKDAPLEEYHKAALYGALGYLALDKLTEVECINCAGDILSRLDQMANAMHDGKLAIEAMQADEATHH